jgi:hypothetical protein
MQGVSVVATLVLWAHGVKATGVPLPRGYPDCPCIDPWPLSGPGTNATNCSGVQRTGDGACYSRSYGAQGCQSYDSAVAHQCQTSSPPAWCADQWCYVSPWNCRKPSTRSSYFPEVVMSNETMLAEAGIDVGKLTSCSGPKPNELIYSYATCGNVDTFSFDVGFTQEIAAIAARGPIRIAIPGDEPPYITTVPPEQTRFVQGTSRRDGSIVRYTTRFLDWIGLPWVEVPITPESRTFSPSSSFTACVHDVALNNTESRR